MEQKTTFAPVLAIPNGVTNIDFYKNAFNAIEHMRLNNDDGSVHVAELVIDGAMFHLHEITDFTGTVTPDSLNGGTVTLGLMVDDVHAVFDSAIAAGARIASPVQDYDYGYRQGELLDPFGHRWMIERKI